MADPISHSRLVRRNQGAAFALPLPDPPDLPAEEARQGAWHAEYLRLLEEGQTLLDQKAAAPQGTKTDFTQTEGAPSSELVEKTPGAPEQVTSQIIRAPVYGAAKGVEETASALMAGWDWLVGNDPQKRAELRALTDLVGGQPANPVARGLAGVTQFATLFSPLRAGAAAVGIAGSTAKNLAGGALAGGATGMLAFDPYEERLSTMLHAVPGLNAVVPAWMASTDREDGELVNRMRNAIEEAGLGFAADGIVEGLKIYRGIKRGGRPERLAAPEEKVAGVAAARTEAVEDFSAGLDDFEGMMNGFDEGAEQASTADVLAAWGKPGATPAAAPEPATAWGTPTAAAAAPKPDAWKEAVLAATDTLPGTKAGDEVAQRLHRISELDAKETDAWLKDNLTALVEMPDRAWGRVADRLLHAHGPERRLTLLQEPAPPFTGDPGRLGTGENIRSWLEKSRDPTISETERKFVRAMLLDRLDERGFEQMGDVRLRDWIQHAEMRPEVKGSFQGVKAVTDPLTLSQNLDHLPRGQEVLAGQAGKPIEPEYLRGALADPTGQGRAVWMTMGRGGPQTGEHYLEDVTAAVARSRDEGVTRSGAGDAIEAQLLARQSFAQLVEDTIAGLPANLARGYTRDARRVFHVTDLRRDRDAHGPARLDLLLTSGQQAVRMAGSVNTAEGLEGFAEAALRYQQWGRELAGDADGAARLGKLADRLHNERSREEALDALGGREHVTALARAIDETERFGEAMALTKHWVENAPGLRSSSRLDRGIRHLNTWRMSSMLTDPSTHVVNTVGNAAPVMLQIPEHYLAAALRGGERGRALREANGYLAGVGHGLRTAWRLAMRDGAISYGTAAQRSKAWRKAKEENLSGMLMDFGRRPKADVLTGQMSPEALALMKTGAPRSHMPWQVTKDATRYLVNVSFNALQFMDSFFKGINFHAESFRLAAGKAYDEGLTGEAFREFVQREAVRPQRGSEIYNRALEHAERQTFTNDPGRFSQSVIDVMNSAGGTPRLLADIPFMRTPVNLVSYTAQRLPGVNLMFRESRARLAGAQGADERAREVSRMILGGVVMAGLAPLAERGAITGAWGGNKFTRLQDPRDSIRIGDTWIRYDRLPWIGVAAGIVADTSQMMHAAQTDEEFGYAEGMFHLGVIGLGRLAEQMPTTDLFNVFEIGTDLAGGNADAAGAAIGRHLGGIVSSMGPVTGMQRAMARTSNEGLAVETRAGGGVADRHEDALEFWNEWRKEVANRGFPLFQVLREDNPFPRRDLYGEEMPHRGPDPVLNVDGSVTRGERVEFPKLGTFLLGGMAGVAARNDPLSKELRNHASALDIDMPRRMARLRGSSISIEYTPEEYDFIAQTAGQRFWREGSALVGTARYREMDPVHQAAEIQAIQHNALRDARARALERFPDLTERSRLASLARARRRRTR